MNPLFVLAMEPYYGGSHRAMLDGWQRHSRHRIEIVGLPARNWKWRMRHAGLTLAQQTEQRIDEIGQIPDVVFASTMLDLPQWRSGHAKYSDSITSLNYSCKNVGRARPPTGRDAGLPISGRNNELEDPGASGFDHVEHLFESLLAAVVGIGDIPRPIPFIRQETAE